MSRKSVKLPARLDALSARRLIDCASELIVDADVLVDASAVSFAYPYGVATLGAALLRRERLGLDRPGYVAPVQEDTAAFLEEVGFPELVLTGQAHAQGTLSLRRLAPDSLDPIYLHQVAQLIEEWVPQTSESVAYLVELALKELVQNSVEHAQSTTDVVVLARWYKQGGNVRIAISDSGIGIAESLRRNPAYAEAQSASRLVELAVTLEGTTGRTQGRYGGFGLKYLHQICSARNGSVHVTSQEVDATFSPGHLRSDFVRPLAGTTVELDFRPGPDTGDRSAEQKEDFF